MLPMSKLIRENLNQKISVMLSCFEKLNGIMEGYDAKFFEFYEATRINFINILNEIVDNYTYKRPNMYERRSSDVTVNTLKVENDVLREKLKIYEMETKTSQEQIKKLKAEIANITSKAKSANKKEVDVVSPDTNYKKAKTPKELSEIKSSTTLAQQDIERKLNFKETNDKFGGHSKLLPNLTLKEQHQPVININNRILTFKNLKDFIEEVYEGKVVYDAVCKKENKAKETLEQYLFSHLRNKYGLNNIVAEWMYALVEALKTHMGKDNDVTLFALVI